MKAILPKYTAAAAANTTSTTSENRKFAKTTIWLRARRHPALFGRNEASAAFAPLGKRQMAGMLLPILLLIVLVLGGLYGGVFTATESGAVGALGALAIALAKKRLSARGFWRLLTETGHVTASLILLIIAANVYSRMLAVSGLPMYLAQAIQEAGLGFVALMAVYLVVLLILGTLMDSASILLICVPLFLPVFQAFQVDVVWLGVITVIVVEIGLLTPPFGMAVFIVKASINDSSISLHDIFMGTLPFAAVMLAVALMVIAMPWMATAFIR